MAIYLMFAVLAVGHDVHNKTGAALNLLQLSLVRILASDIIWFIFLLDSLCATTL